jgi:hypothetical protein
MTDRTDELLMLTAVTATCTDCGGDRIFVPVDDVATSGEFCCTSCDAAIFLLVTPASRRRRGRGAQSRVA